VQPVVTVALDPRPWSESATAQLRDFARSAPARLIAMGLALIVCCLATGTVTASETATRQHALHGLLANGEPFLNSTQQLYAALSTADAAAGTAFLYGGREPMAVRDRYLAAVDAAATRLAESADGDGSDEWRPLRQGIAGGLPVYTGLVETARTEDRDGHPIGAAYLGEASHLMQTTLLPMAQDLHNRQSAAVAATQRQLDAPPWTEIALFIAVLAGLVGTQIHLARRWRRRLNRGLLTATALLLCLFAWVTVAGSMSAQAASRAADRGTTPLATLSDARILAQQARAAETLKLVRHDTSGDYDRAFDTATGRLATLFAGYQGVGGAQVARARDGLAHWIDAHQRMSASAATGDFDTAAVIAVGPGQQDAAAQFAAVDTALQEGSLAGRAELRGHVADAATDLELLGRGALLLTVGTAIGVVGGLWPRVREYL
jgi:hypothetical protein